MSERIRLRRAFTIIELLVVVSIIAILVGILLPAIGKARNQALLTQSQSNLRQIGTAHGIYAAEWNDRQLTYIVDSIASYGNDPDEAFSEFYAEGNSHPPMIAGTSPTGVTYAYWPPGSKSAFQPIILEDYGTNESGVGSDVKWGAFLAIQFKAFYNYVNGRFYDRVFYAPKDELSVAAIEECLDYPSDYCNTSYTGDVYYASYIMSPAGMFNEQVFAERRDNPGVYYTDPWSIAAGFRSPSFSVARHPDLKTHMLERHWLQNQKSGAFCNHEFPNTPTFEGCEPYFFNHGRNSAPVTLFYDGHVALSNVSEAMNADQRAEQTAAAPYGPATRPSVPTATGKTSPSTTPTPVTISSPSMVSAAATSTQSRDAT